MSLRRTFALLGTVLALAACNQGAEPDRADAGGEILEGSTSDAMLPLDSVRSQPPLAKSTGTASGRPGAAGADPSENDADTEGEGEADEAPAPAETPETTPDAAPPTP